MKTRSVLQFARLVLGVILLCSLALGSLTPAHAGGMCFVDAAAAGSNDGTTWTDAFTSLQSALGALQCNEVWVAAATYTPTSGADRTVSFVLRDNLALYGGFAGNETLLSQRNPAANPTILSGDIGTPGDASDNSYHVLLGDGTHATARLDGFTITAGYASGEADQDQYGGGIYISAGSPTLANLILIENRALYYGGGMYNSAGSSPSLTNVTFSGNLAEDEYGGGGGMLNDASSPNLSRVLFSDNWSRYGGGMRNLNGSRPTLTNVTFNNNRSHVGGGMNNNASSPSLTGVFFNNNYGYDAGGLNNENASSPSLVNVTFTGNRADEWGGGMVNYYHSDATLTNVTFSSNSAGESGGGMYNSNSTPTLTHVTFRGNKAALRDIGNGGGMFNYASSPRLTNVTFQENIAIYEDFAGGGGGMSNFSGSSPSLSHVTFLDNWAYDGGGMFNSDSSNPSLANVTFRQNIGLIRGGGMSNAGGSSPTLKNVDFDHNQANFGSGMLNIGGSNPTLMNVTFHGGWGEEGSGMLNHQSNPTLVNVTFTDNTVLGGFGLGGAMRNYRSNPRLTNVTISGNSSQDEGGGGGIYNDQSSPIITNSIVFGNTEGNIVNQAGSPLVTYSIVQGGYPGTGNLDADPLLGPLQNNGGFTSTMALGAGSPAIDAGTDSVCPAFDQRGVKRPQGAHCDMGAFEYQAALLKILTLRSTPREDGWILESGEQTGSGGSKNAAAPTLRLGDDAADRQYRSILSFETSALPDHVVITGARLRIRRQALTGTDPFTTHGWLRADIRKGPFSSAASLQLSDFNAAASGGAVGAFGRTSLNGWYTAEIPSTAFRYINTTGLTQFRLRFSLDDNDDRDADFMQFYSGDAAANRPVLILTYYVP